MLYLIQTGPAQTEKFFIVGYCVIFGVMALYWMSLGFRRKNIMLDLETLEESHKKSGL
jgi:hypothetical protein